MITLKELHTEKEMELFVAFSFSLYKDNPYWVPPIIKSELESFDRHKNPVLEHANVRFFLAYKSNKIVGKICAIINWKEVKEQKIKKMRFGWFDVIDDIEVTSVLLNKVKEIGIENKLEYIEGPVGFSNLDKVGVLTEGFDYIGTMITWYNYPYYKEHLERLGYEKEKEFSENEFGVEDLDAKSYSRISRLIKKRYQLKALYFAKTKDIMPHVDDMFDLFNESYASLSSFVPISKKQQDYFKNKYMNFINPEYIKFVTDENDKIVAFGIVMPSFSKALQKAKGKLFPFGFLHLLKAKKYSKEVVFYLIGVEPKYQNKGITGIIFEEFAKTFTKKGVTTCVRGPELKENTAIRQLWKSFDSVVRKRRCTYRRNL